MQIGVRWMCLGALPCGGFDPYHSLVEHRHMNRSIAAEDMDRVLRFDGSVSHRQHTSHPALECKQRNRGIFYLAIKQQARCRADGACDGAENVQQDFDTVAAKVEHGSAAGFRLFDQPVPRMAGIRIESLKCIDLGYYRP